jgi:hypothetical protein
MAGLEIRPRRPRHCAAGHSTSRPLTGTSRLGSLGLSVLSTSLPSKGPRGAVLSLIEVDDRAAGAGPEPDGRAGTRATARRGTLAKRHDVRSAVAVPVNDREGPRTERQGFPRLGRAQVHAAAPRGEAAEPIADQGHDALEMEGKDEVRHTVTVEVGHLDVAIVEGQRRKARRGPGPPAAGAVPEKDGGHPATTLSWRSEDDVEMAVTIDFHAQMPIVVGDHVQFDPVRQTHARALGIDPAVRPRPRHVHDVVLASLLVDQPPTIRRQRTLEGGRGQGWLCGERRSEAAGEQGGRHARGDP